MARNYMQGLYEIKHPEKYKGDPSKCTYRSSYELQVWKWCDDRRAVLEWSVESIVVPYFDPVSNKKRRYIVDLWFKYMDSKGNVHTEICEIKPAAQTKPPTKGKKKKETIINETATYITNQAKWEAASEFARQRSWNFRILTENAIFK